MTNRNFVFFFSRLESKNTCKQVNIILKAHLRYENFVKYCLKTREKFHEANKNCYIPKA